jgi:beta-N-acetylhexosaminidase
VTASLLRLVALVPLLVPAAAQAATLEQMAGQMIVIGFEGAKADAPAVVALRDELADGAIGGVMFLKKNVASLADVKAMNAAFRAAAPDLVPFITLDQEGGAVERLTKAVGFTEIPTAKAIAAEKTPEQAEAIFARMAEGVADLGFTVNFGPVADLLLNTDNQVIAKFGRSFGADVDTVVAYDEAFIRAHRGAGVLTSLKHFPGHGSSTADSHEGFVDISKSWSPVELEPYRQMIADDLVDMIMVGHLYHGDYDPEGLKIPSSLSSAWLEGVLRKDLGFDGVIISDDLEMGAIRDHFTLQQTVTIAVRAGVDVMLFSNTAKYRAGLNREILDILLKEAEADQSFADRIEESYGRILALKQSISSPNSAELPVQ